MKNKKFNTIDLALAINLFTKKKVLHSDIIKSYHKIENTIVWNREIIYCTLVITEDNNVFYKEMENSLVIMILLDLKITYHDIDKIFGFYDLEINQNNEDL